MSPFPTHAEELRSLQEHYEYEVARLTARNDDLEKQLADVLVDIITLESENANKHHVDELLFKANARIHELEGVGDQSAARAIEDENAQYTGEGVLKVVPHEKPAAPALRCKCFNEAPYTNPEDGVVYGPGCVNPDHNSVENECSGYNTSCCCYAPAAPITPLAKAGEPGVAHTPASPVSSTGASPSQGDKVEERDGKAAVRCPNCNSDNVDCYDINTLDSGCWKCLSCGLKWDTHGKATTALSVKESLRKYDNGGSLIDLVLEDAVRERATTASVFAEVCECGHDKSEHDRELGCLHWIKPDACTQYQCDCRHFKAKGGST